MQKEDFTKDSYELLQHAICNSINMKSINIGQAYDDLIIVARKLQTKPENTIIHELIFALRSVFESVMDVQLIKKDELSKRYRNWEQRDIEGCFN